MDQIVTAEKYVIRHHLGGVISQSFVATEQAIGSAAIRSLRGALPGRILRPRHGAGGLG
jgi:hypothetical protein